MARKIGFDSLRIIPDAAYQDCYNEFEKWLSIYGIAPVLGVLADVIEARSNSDFGQPHSSERREFVACMAVRSIISSARHQIEQRLAPLKR